ncbi:HdeD family acid-resistance protein [Nitrosomonas sp.]|uniref:HdeD family acid-resistance protein n=1 Tax=Nitrosomonas sp. TaxID=42353 RepID=UPI002732509E|nr:DUF308 domain-containing protein [Nitrosomonas sp.]
MQPTNNQLNQPSASRWLIIFGLTFLFGGIVVLILPAAVSIAIESLLGWLFFVGGCIQIVCQIVAALTVRANKLFWFKLPWAILFVLVGLWLILRPVEGIQALAFIVGLLFLVEAIMKFVFSWRWRSVSKIGLALLSGVLSFLIRKIVQPNPFFSLIRRILTQANPPTKRNCHGHEPYPIPSRLVLTCIPCAVWHR